MAADRLRITPELLYYYTSDSFAETTGFRSLRTIPGGPTTRFSAEELDAFDLQLAGKWASKPGTRAKVPQAVETHLRVEAMNRCARCDKGAGVQTAHIVPWAVSKCNHHANLVRVCSECHAEHDRHQSLSTEELAAIKAKVVELTRVRLRARAGRPELFRPAPRPRSGFVGRERQCAELVSRLGQGQSVMITGIGGGGKTELLVQAMAATASERPVLWIDVDRYRNAGDVIGALQASLGIEGEPCLPEQIPGRLDELEACVVFDGVELASMDDLDTFEDEVQHLIRSTRATQFAITSQVVLHSVTVDYHLSLGLLDAPAARAILLSSSKGLSHPADGLEALLAFCDGHPLTLRLASALVNHFGSAASAMGAIGRKGAEAIKLPARKRHDRASSLDLCLATAYDSLGSGARMLLWALANMPAGAFTHYIEKGMLETSDPVEELADLNRWNLVERHAVTDDIDRTTMLRPVMAFALHRGVNEGGADYAAQVSKVVQSVTFQLAALDMRLEEGATPQLTWHRYGQELPNFLNVLELARQPGAASDTRKSAVTIASALMRYFFVIGPHERGARLMLDAAELAYADKNAKRACSLVLQSIALAKRADSSRLIEQASGLLTRLEKEVTDPEALADLAMCHAILSEDTADNADAGRRAVDAYRAYAGRLRAAARRTWTDPYPTHSHGDALAEAHNDLSGALAAWAMALLKSGEYGRAKRAYLHSMRHQRGEHIDVNRGQTLHQLGNCESHLGHIEVAMAYYMKAAEIFDAMSMSGYLSNALGEYGYALLDAPRYRSTRIDGGLLQSGMHDLENDLRLTLRDTAVASAAACMRLLRKTAGMMILASRFGATGPLVEFADRLHAEVVAPAHRRVLAGGPADGSAFYLRSIDTVLLTALMLAEIADVMAAAPETLPEELIDRLLLLVGNESGDEWGLTHLRMADWISDVITIRWEIDGADRSAVTALFEDINFGDPEPLVLRWRR